MESVTYKMHKHLGILVLIVFSCISFANGVKYGGGPSTAGALMDRAQGQMPSAGNQRGRARAHALYIGGGPEDSLQTYSLQAGSQIKVGFLSRQIQDRVVDQALMSGPGQDTIKRLNEEPHIGCCLTVNVPVTDPEPIVAYRYGYYKFDLDLVSVDLMLCYFVGETQPDSDVFIGNAAPNGINPRKYHSYRPQY